MLNFVCILHVYRAISSPVRWLWRFVAFCLIIYSFEFKRYTLAKRNFRQFRLFSSVSVCTEMVRASSAFCLRAKSKQQQHTDKAAPENLVLQYTWSAQSFDNLCLNKVFSSKRERERKKEKLYAPKASVSIIAFVVKTGRIVPAPLKYHRRWYTHTNTHF